MRSPLFVSPSWQFSQPRKGHEERFSFILDSCPIAKWRHGTRISPILDQWDADRAQGS